MFFILKKNFIINMMLIITGVSFLVYASSSGITGATKKNGDGCNCHGSASPGVTVTINGPDVITIGQTINYTVTITGGTLTAGGTNIAASLGSLTAMAGLKKVVDELTHTSPKSPTAGVVTFDFSYTAPSETGTVTLYANGNSVNGNGSASGDQWNFAPNKVITVNPIVNIDDAGSVLAFELEQNYPNPFNPSTVINYQTKSGGFVTLKVHNITGKEIAELVNEVKSAGTHSVAFNAGEINGGLSSGIYFYTLQSGNFKDAKKMILAK